MISAFQDENDFLTNIWDLKNCVYLWMVSLNINFWFVFFILKIKYASHINWLLVMSQRLC